MIKNYDVIGFAIKFFSMLLALLVPIRPALLAVSVLTFADLISGIWASLKEGKKLTSSGLRRTLIKVLAYQASIIVAYVMQTYLLDGMPVVNVITGLIGITEGKSFFENVNRITGIDFWTEIISKLNMPDIKNKSDQEPKP